MINSTKSNGAFITETQLAGLGGGKLAYVRSMLSDDVNRMFPEAPELTPGLELYALVGADGTPILVTDSREAAFANAWEHELETVSLH